MTREAQIRQTAAEWLRYNHPTCTQDMLVEAFRCGAEWADRNRPNPWTRLEDRWPIDEGRILVYEGKGGSSVYDVYSIGKGIYWDEYGKNDLDGDELRLILYWMKMPDLHFGMDV